MADAVRHNGVVKIYYELKGFGFITRGKGKDLYFSQLDFADMPARVEGLQVTFEVEATPKGPRAIAIRG
jgi:CspA family cold shock protein